MHSDRGKKPRCVLSSLKLEKDVESLFHSVLEEGERLTFLNHFLPRSKSYSKKWFKFQPALQPYRNQLSKSTALLTRPLSFWEEV